ncbi:hypothetical protein FQN57_003047 [Myotisia sp. PD_48]|nr:hypothetical protein FQN57_003047 [Myotisia sp. PD_48]
MAPNTLSLNDFPSSYIKALNDSLAADTEFVAPSDANLPIHPEGYIPPIIHRTYKSLQFPSKWTEAFNSCQTFNPEFTHYYWTDVSARELIETHFEWFLPTYNSYQYSIQRVDALRYFLLWHYGGIYIDMDIGCRRNLTPLLSYPAWVPRTWPFGVSNDLMASSPRHPLMMKVALSLQDHNRWYISKYITVFFSTGPMFLSGILAAWFKSQPTRLGPGTDLDKISILGGSSGRDTQEILNSNFKKPHGLAFLPSMLYDTTDYTFFGHYPGSTWHGNDVAAIMWLYQHIWLLCVICIMLYITDLNREMFVPPAILRGQDDLLVVVSRLPCPMMVHDRRDQVLCKKVEISEVSSLKTKKTLVTNIITRPLNWILTQFASMLCEYYPVTTRCLISLLVYFNWATYSDHITQISN